MHKLSRLILTGMILGGLLSLPSHRRAYAGGEILVQPTSSLITNESGGTAAFTIQLNTRPNSSVHIDLHSSDPTEGIVNPVTLVLNPGNWALPQAVVVTGVDDQQVDGDVAYSVVTSPAVSNDSVFDGVDAPDAGLVNQDNDHSVNVIAKDDNDVTSEDTPVTTPVLANDSGLVLVPITLSVITGPSHGVTAITFDNQITYTPDANYNGKDEYRYQVCDVILSCSDARVRITVQPVNDPPIAVDDTATVDEDQSVTIDVLANDQDIDNDPLKLISVTSPSHGTATVLNNRAVYTPQSNFSGTDSFTYTIEDGQGGSASATVTVTVNPVNDPPQPQGDSISTTEGTAVTIAVLNNDTDPDGDPVQLLDFPAASAQQGALSRDINSTPGDLTDDRVIYTPPAGFQGTDSFDYTVSDGSLIASAQVTIQVSAGSPVPLANDDNYQAEGGTLLHVDSSMGVLSNDVSTAGSSLTATLVTSPSHGSLALNPDGAFDYTSDPTFSGVDQFHYQATDGVVASTPATVTINVVSAAVQPVAVADSFTVDGDGGLTVPAPGVLGNDQSSSGGSLQAEVVTLAQHGTLVLNSDGSFQYTPQAGFSGSDQFSYRVIDGFMQSEPAVVEILVPDRQAPDGHWIAPVSDGQRYDVAFGSLQLEVGASDNVAVDHVSIFRWDSVQLQYVDIANLTSPPFSAQLDCSPLNPGWNQVFMRAYDAAGNASERQFIWLYKTGITLFYPLTSVP